MDAALSFFVTGATSSAGRAAVRQLAAKGHRVTGMTTGSVGAAEVRAAGGLPVFADPYRAGEIKSMLVMAKTDVIAHLATQIPNHIPHRGADWDVRVFTDGVTALLDAAKAAGVKFVVYTSYAFLYGDTGGEWVDESADLHAPGDFPVFEAAVHAEQMVLTSGIPACILRSGFVYGPTSDALEAMANTLRAARPVVTGSDDHFANWTHSDDLAQAVMLAAQSQPAGEIFNIVDDAPVTSAAFLGDFAQSLGVTRPESAPGFLSAVMMNKAQSALLNISVKVRNTKAKEKLGWQPRYPTHRQGIEQTLMHWRAEGAPLKASG